MFNFIKPSVSNIQSYMDHEIIGIEVSQCNQSSTNQHISVCYFELWQGVKSLTFRFANVLTHIDKIVLAAPPFNFLACGIWFLKKYTNGQRPIERRRVRKKQVGARNIIASLERRPLSGKQGVLLALPILGGSAADCRRILYATRRVEMLCVLKHTHWTWRLLLPIPTGWESIKRNGQHACPASGLFFAATCSSRRPQSAISVPQGATGRFCTTHWWRKLQPAQIEKLMTFFFHPFGQVLKRPGGSDINWYTT